MEHQIAKRLCAALHSLEVGAEIVSEKDVQARKEQSSGPHASHSRMVPDGRLYTGTIRLQDLPIDRIYISSHYGSGAPDSYEVSYFVDTNKPGDLIRIRKLGKSLLSIDTDPQNLSEDLQDIRVELSQGIGVRLFTQIPPSFSLTRSRFDTYCRIARSLRSRMDAVAVSEEELKKKGRPRSHIFRLALFFLIALSIFALLSLLEYFDIH
jgi:hypothetical protein